MPDKPAASDPDPITSKSLSVPLLISTLILMSTLVWAVYDEVYIMRPWKDYQRYWIRAYTSFLTKLGPRQAEKAEQIKATPDYQELDRQLEEAEAAVADRIREIDRQASRGITPRIAAARGKFQTLRSEIGALTYLLETASSESEKERLRGEIEVVKQRKVEVALPKADGSGDIETLQMTYPELEAEYLGSQKTRGELQAERLLIVNPVNAIRKKRDALMADRLSGLSALQIDGLIAKMQDFDIGIRQIHLSDIDLVDRCESCHLGIREPVTITRADMRGRGMLISHPRQDLLRVHDPEEFGCTLCHNGNGRATRNATKGHGRHKFWLWPMFEKENVEAGCHKCHAREIVTVGAETLNKGRELFLNKGCWGCHRFEGFDRESEELLEARRRIRNLTNERAANEKERRISLESGDTAESDDEAQRFYARAEELKLRNSRIDARTHTLRTEERSLAKEVKKFGPSLKEIKVKDRKEWIPVWLKNPYEFRPGAQMPVFRLRDEDIERIAAYIWQNALEGELEQHPAGDAERGKELFETRGCMGCHSIGEGAERFGGDFAANLSRVGEKTNYNFLVRWIHNPAEVTPDPNMPDELRPRPIMPNLRLSVEESRDIASYLITQKTEATYPPADFMDDPLLAQEGLSLIRLYGCAGCHEIAGLESEGRIGTELTLEGSKPVERLDFALFTHPAETEGWYDHKGFFERKLRDPAFFDQGKVREPLEKLRMPNFNLSDDEITALTTFLIGAVDQSLLQHYRFEPEDDRAAVQRGWWIIKRYNCNGCHQIRPGDVSAFMGIPRYADDPDWAEQFPPQLYTEGARAQPDWLFSFLRDPALSETDIHRNGVRGYLQARMPTFYFSDRQVGALMKFFMARSSQPHPYSPEELEPLSQAERAMGRALFSSKEAPCLKCHMTGDPAHDRIATAPNFLIAAERLKPDWTFRWLIEPAGIAPGTAMPSGLFRREGERWVANGELPAALSGYEKDHARLLVRYMFQMDGAELRRLQALQ